MKARPLSRPMAKIMIRSGYDGGGGGGGGGDDECNVIVKCYVMKLLCCDK